MPDKLELAPSGRARCRGCGAKIDKDAVRFGEVLPRPSGDDDATSVFWFHPRCAAHRRPEKFVRLLRPEAGEAEPAVDAAALPELPDRDRLLAEADVAILHPRLARIAGVERASSGRARCRHCKEVIALDDWRIRLASFADTGFPEPLGFIHAGCGLAYFETPDGVAADPATILEHVRQACPDLAAVELDAIAPAISQPRSQPQNQPPNPPDRAS
jgi:hypothetical protein